MAATLLTVGVGPFGSAIERRLHALRDDVVSISADAVLSDAVPRPHAVLLSSWRRSDALALQMEAWCRRVGCAFLPAVQDTGGVLVGPLVLPGEEGCFRCFLQRTRDASPYREALEAVSDWYDTHGDQGPRGYLEPFALIAAARVSQIIDDIRRGEAAGGTLWRIGYVNRDVVVSRVVGVHDCTACGLLRPAATRSFGDMRRALDAAGFWHHA